MYVYQVQFRQLPQYIKVAGNQKILGDQSHRIAILEKNFKTAARQLKLALDRLVGIRVPRECNNLRLPRFSLESLLQQLRRFRLHEYLRFKVNPHGKAQVLVKRRA